MSRKPVSNPARENKFYFVRRDMDALEDVMRENEKLFAAVKLAQEALADERRRRIKAETALAWYTVNKIRFSR